LPLSEQARGEKKPSVILRLLNTLKHLIVKGIVAIRSDSQDPFGSVDSKVQNTCVILENIVKFANKGICFKK
jgi:hypothetical protein